MSKRIFIVIGAFLLSVMTVTASFAQQKQNQAGAVYVMTNAPGGNEVAVFNRDAKGMLTFMDSYTTQGLGSGGGAVDPLGSQGSLILSQDKRWLLAVNAGSNEISVFQVGPDGLKLTDVVYSGGEFPVSLSLYHDLLYVLNAGTGAESPNIVGFKLSHRGKLTRLDDSIRELGNGGFHQVGFDPQGDVLVVTQGEPGRTNAIHVFSVDEDGLPEAIPVTSPSEGQVPFGFIFDQRGHLLVSEAGSGAVSSYEILGDNSLRSISSSIENGQAATCWIAGNSRGLVYTANTGSGTISAYKLQSGKGRLVLLDAAAGSGNGPIDLTTTGNGLFLYVLNASAGTVGIFRINPDGSLQDLGVMGGLPRPFTQGIVGR
jgi:6-phosphogluconolactonase